MWSFTGKVAFCEEVEFPKDRVKLCRGEKIITLSNIKSVQGEKALGEWSYPDPVGSSWSIAQNP